MSSDNINAEELKAEFKEIISEFLSKLETKDCKIMVLGCSTSEITGSFLGQSSSPVLGEIIVETLLESLKPFDISLAVQCCEHLNRALVVEKDFAQKNNLEIVSVVPQPKAGGSAATAAYKLYNRPVVVEFIKADAGIDIGGTFVGMHLKHVSVPLRMKKNKLGHAHLTFSKTRPKYIGGARAVYNS